MSQNEPDTQVYSDDNPQRYTREYLLSEMSRLNDQLEHAPRVCDMRQLGDVSVDPFRREFGSWNNALEAAGCKENQRKGITKADLIEELHRLDKFILFRSPTTTLMKERGEYSVGTYQDRFGTWNNALRSAGFRVNQEKGRVNSKYGIGWSEEKRRTIREREGFECWSCPCTQDEHIQICGMKLHVHHIVRVEDFSIYDPRANSPENLVTLCKECHGAWESADGYTPPGETLPPDCSPPDPDAEVTLGDYC